MFVSPPPASLASQVLLQRKSSKRAGHHHHNHHNTNNTINSDVNSNSINEDNTPSLYHVTSNESGSSQNSNHSNNSQESRKDAAFINTPLEYSNRARDEIRKRLLASNGSTTHSTLPTNKINKVYSRVSENALSRVSTTRTSIDDSSLISDRASSIFSHPSTMISNNTNVTDGSSTSTVNHHTAFNKMMNSPHYITQISLEDALPKTFYDMYTPDVLLSDPSKVLYNGRPSFTKRELLDWDLNDIRSLLIVETLKPEWGNQLPEILNPGPNLPKFKLQLLPLNSSDNFIISTLINSDLYMEANLDYEFKLTSAKYTVAAARTRHEQIIGHHEAVMNLSKPEWRNIIENYLLNIAVEAQCRFDFKQRCSEYKRWKQQELQLQLQKEEDLRRQQNLTKPNMPPPKTVPNKNSNLLKMTLMKNFSKNTTNNNAPKQENKNINPTLQDLRNSQAIKISLSQDEKANIWSQCQAQVYQRLGLDWKPDGVR
ncbi:protein Std1p [Monosporozyma unispora]|nr:hypothetical protein C6P44_003367 [Kazachstania unispora]